MTGFKGIRHIIVFIFLALTWLSSACGVPPQPTLSTHSPPAATRMPESTRANPPPTSTASLAFTPESTAIFTQTEAAPAPALPHAILGDLRVRQAIANCTDKTALIAAVYPWLEDRQSFMMDSFLPNDHPDYGGDEAGLTPDGYDPQKGEQALEQAGWTLPAGSPYRQNATGQRLSLNLTTTQAEFRKMWVAVFIEQMKTCGIEILPSYLSAEKFFGDGADDPGELGRCNFDLAAFSWVTQPESDLRALYGCDQIPTTENNWQGQNFSAWCNEPVQAALQQLNSTLEKAGRRQAYHLIQLEYTQDLPGVPLFTRLELNVADPELENFSPDPGEVYTWNAAQWTIPGKDQIVIGLSAEPSSLFPLEHSYVSQLIQALVYGLDYTNLDYGFQPVTLKQIPSIENGLAINAPMMVSQGEAIVDANNNPVQLEPGVKIYTPQGEEITYTGGSVEMQRLIVEFQFDEDLFWSDGAPVVGEDYELAYRALCDPATGANQYLPPLPACDKIADVSFASDSSYVIAWKPGYLEPAALLPPFGRLPAHQVVWSGQTMADAESKQWIDEDAVARQPLGIGPYTVRQWEYGKQMVLVANPYYFRGAPATDTIVIKFIPIDSGLQPVTLIEQDAVDLIGFDSLNNLGATDESLVMAQEEGKIRLYPTPVIYFEQIIFNLIQH